jgi:tetratricopeptide (TPR) repeat protein
MGVPGTSHPIDVDQEKPSMAVSALIPRAFTPGAERLPGAAPVTPERPWEATGRYRAAREAAEQAGPQDLRRAGSLYRLAQLYREVGEDDEAEPLLRQALEIQERALGPAHPQVALTLSSLMFLYRSLGNEPEAAAAAARVHTIMVTQARQTVIT